MTRDRDPNIILILADDMGYGDFSRFNGGQSSTPALDALMDSGLRCTQHYAGSPVCAPARAALLTGRYPQRMGVIDTLEARGTDRMALRETTLADALLRRGYRTGLVGKWHNGAVDPRYHPTRRGFEEFIGFRGGWQDYRDWNLEHNGHRLPSDGRYLTHVLTEEAVGFVRRHRDHPFFLHLAFNAPHFPFEAPPASIDRFRAEGRSETVATIYAMIAELDAGVETLLNELDRLGIDEDTLVLFTSDNGPQLDGTGETSTVRDNGGLAGQKQLVLDGGIRLPLIARWPGHVPAGGRSTAFIHSMDLFPTILDLLGESWRPALPLDGVSQVDAIFGDGSGHNIERCWQWTRYAPLPRSNAAIRSGDWKLVYPAIPATIGLAEKDRLIDEAVKREPESFTSVDNSDIPSYEAIRPKAPMLFDVRADPGESQDLADSRPDVVSRLSARLATWFETVEAERSSVDG